MAAEGIILIDDRGNITAFNRTSVKIFGYLPDEVLGQNVSRLMPAPAAGRHQESIDRYLRTGEAKIIGFGREVTGLRKDGSTFPMELAVSEVQQGGRRSFTGIVRDVSQRRQLEKEILDVSEREQRRIGKALHDGLCQELAGIALLVKSLAHQSETGDLPQRSACEDVARYLQSAVGHARLLARNLAPVEPLSTGLVAALKQLVADTQEETHVRCRFVCAKPTEVHDANVAINIYRIVQECLRNAAGSAAVASFGVTLVCASDGLELTVRVKVLRRKAIKELERKLVDDMIRHRARVLGGEIAASRDKDSAVKIVCRIPVPEAKRDDEK